MSGSGSPDMDSEVDAAIVDGGTAVSGADWLRVEPSELWMLLNQLVGW
jgi:hypothetical protein